MLHDESVFPEPLRFQPERFLDPDVKPLDVTFGFGCHGRTCPGGFMARSPMWITVVSVLAAFEISPVVDGHGVPQIPNEEYSGGIIS
jgi:cytochrome P450